MTVWLQNMTSTQNHYIGNIAAIILIFTMFAANYRKANGKKLEYRMLMHILGNIGFYSLVEILSCLPDGVPGKGWTVLLYLLNSDLFILNMVLAAGWTQFTAIHLGYAVPKRTVRVLGGVMLAGVAILIVNIFTPVVFSLEGNVYRQTGFLYYAFITIAGIFFCYTVHIYAVCRKNGGVLKYFPVWLYIMPSLIGMVLESATGSSYLSVCNAVAISAVMVSMQQEEVFRDRLTGLYNRAYLEELKEKLEKTQNPYVSGIMLDLNGFKHINDDFGHAEGDRALISAAELIRRGAGSYGDAIRYAGDEFIVIMNTWDQDQLEKCVDRISRNFAEFNQSGERPYKLSASMGYANFNAGTQTVNEFMNAIDKNMYENKREYYKEHSNDRRKR